MISNSRAISRLPRPHIAPLYRYICRAEDRALLEGLELAVERLQDVRSQRPSFCSLFVSRSPL